MSFCLLSEDEYILDAFASISVVIDPNTATVNITISISTNVNPLFVDFNNFIINRYKFVITNDSLSGL